MGLLRDGLVTYNHRPPGGSLESNDFFTAMEHDLAHIRAVGVGWTFMLSRPGQRWRQLSAADVISIWGRAAEAIRGERDHGADLDELDPRFWHELWLRTAPRLSVSDSWHPLSDDPPPL